MCWKCAYQTGGRRVDEFDLLTGETLDTGVPFSNHFNINSSAVFVTWRPNYDIFIVNSVKTDFSVRSSTFHIHAILKHAPVLSQNSLKMQLLYALSAALLQKRVRCHSLICIYS